MAEVNIQNIEQMLTRIVKPDGRIGGCQFAVGQKVTVLTYPNIEDADN
jgi:hypothetical protein